MRWAVYRRRYECAESTLRTDMYAVRFVYAWGDRCFPEGLESRLERGALGLNELADLHTFLESPPFDSPGLATKRELRLPAITGRRALAIKAFLKWSHDRANRCRFGCY